MQASVAVAADSSGQVSLQCLLNSPRFANLSTFERVVQKNRGVIYRNMASLSIPLLQRRIVSLDISNLTTLSYQAIVHVHSHHHDGA